MKVILRQFSHLPHLSGASWGIFSLWFSTQVFLIHVRVMWGQMKQPVISYNHYKYELWIATQDPEAKAQIFSLPYCLFYRDFENNLHLKKCYLKIKPGMVA